MKNEEELVASLPSGLLINGGWRESGTGGRILVDDPATGTTVAAVADATPQDAEAALDSAVAAQESWARTAPRARAELLRHGFEALTAKADDFALLMTLETGKPLREARAELAYGAEFLRWFGEEASRVSGRYQTAPDGSSRLLVSTRPVGPALLITPWNFPLAMVARKAAPAIAAGCTMVVKPSELAPLTALLFAQTMAEIGLPPGVLNVVTTSRARETMKPLLSDPRLRKLSFTGSTSVGVELLGSSANTVLRTSMELGGNAPFIVFDDCDVDEAVEGAVVAKLRNAGEACTAANRFYVHESVAERFSEQLARSMGAMRVGRGTDPEVDLGPLISERARRNVVAMVDDALARGAVARCGGRKVEGPGYFYEATVLGGVPADARVMREEIFGPVAPISTFCDEKEVVALANATPFGLASYVFTRDLDRVIRMSEQLESAMVGVNTGVVSNPAAPFGGMKQSGLGREGGNEGISEFLETVYLNLADPERSAARTHGQRSVGV